MRLAVWKKSLVNLYSIAPWRNTTSQCTSCSTARLQDEACRSLPPKNNES